MSRNFMNIDAEIVCREWPSGAYKGVYLNSGSCGVKPRSVLQRIEEGWKQLNENPTLMTFLDSSPWENARKAAAELFQLAPQQLMLIPNTTFGIQLVMQSLLLEEGDEFISSDQEHSCVNTLARYLAEKRGIVWRKLSFDAFAGSAEFCRGLLNLVNSRTKLVLASQINCLTGWRPCLEPLVEELAQASIPLLVDGAHAPGQGPCLPARYPFWVSSAHKWMGAPNGTGFLYARPEYAERLRPLTLGDRFYNESFDGMHRLEWPGTCDPVRLLGLEAALKLQLELGPEKIALRQKELHGYLRDCMKVLPEAKIRTPWVEGETSALFALYWSPAQVKVNDLRQALWQDYSIYTQPDFASATPGLGMRVSCNVYNSEPEIDRLIQALRELLH